MRRLISSLFLLTLATAACGDSTRPESGGRYQATLTTPAGHTNGAAVIELAGAGIDSVTATDAQVFVERTGGDVRVVVVRDVPGTLGFAVHVARGSKAPTATIVEVADGNDQLRSTAGYAVRFAR